MPSISSPIDIHQAIHRAMPAPYAKSRDIAAKYDETADEHYDLRYKDVQYQKYDLLLGNAQRMLGSIGMARFLQDVIIDSGCGSGLLVSWLAERGLLGRARVVGIDISRGMLTVARRKAPRRPGTDFIQATAELPPLRDAIAAAAFSVSTYQNLDKVQQVTYIPALRNLLKPRDALLLLSVLRKFALPDATASIEAILRDKFSRVLVAPDDRRVEDRLLVCADP
jgi:SAM-dependent methyltransferase